jgi:hypothetical protein
MTYVIGRGVRVEVGTTEGSAKTVSEVTAADPPVATSTAHGLTVKSIGYFATATGMPQLEGQAVRFSAVTTNDLTLEDLDTTNYGDFTAGTLVPITAWSTLTSSTGSNKSGGDANPLDITVLLDEINQSVQGPLSAELVTFSGRAETIAAGALQAVREAARSAGYLVFRITLKDGNVRYFRGQPALPTENIQQGQVASYDFAVTVKQLYLQGAA